jgi:TolB-like protein/tetratricopeptide (TPR) repeat protein
MKNSYLSKSTVTSPCAFPDSAGNGYFADGITEDLLTQLSRVSALRVISRTSVMPYRGTEKNLREIGQDLGVQYLVEGSVRRSGERVLITAQLIDARTDHHVWAGKYQHDVGDVFSVQAEIAQHIADSLAVKLTPEEQQRIEKAPTRSAAAYDFYLRGRDYYNRSREADNEIAITLFRRAVEADPSFALAYAGLSDALAAKAQALGQTVGWADSAVVYAKRAITLDSALAEGYKALGTAYCAKKRYRDALPPLQQAVSLNPNLYSAVSYMGNVSATVGRIDQALPWHRQAELLNPAARPLTLWYQAYDYAAVGMFSEAEERLSQALLLQPDLMAAQRFSVILSVLRGQNEQAIRRAERLVAENAEDAASWRQAAMGVLLAGGADRALPFYEKAYGLAPAAADVAVGYAYVLDQAGEQRRASRLLEEFEARARAELDGGNEDPGYTYALAAVYAIRGQRAEANRWLREAATMGWHGYYFARVDPRLENLRGDEEFETIMRGVKDRLDTMKRQARRRA